MFYSFSIKQRQIFLLFGKVDGRSFDGGEIDVGLRGHLAPGGPHGLALPDTNAGRSAAWTSV